MVLLSLGKGNEGGEKKKKKEGGHGMRLGKYELGRTLGEGNFGKVKFARDTDSGQLFAVKILEKNKIMDLNVTDQVWSRLLLILTLLLFLFLCFSLLSHLHVLSNSLEILIQTQCLALSLSLSCFCYDFNGQKPLDR